MNKFIPILLILICFSSGASAWYNYDWDNRIPVEINNSGKPALNDYQFNVSFAFGINATSIRVVNESTVVPHWCENVTDGLCYELWFNASVGSEVNTDHYIYYGNDDVASTSCYDNTFIKKYNDSGLVLELHMDKGAGLQTNDTSGNGNHGTLVGGTAWQGVDGGQWNGRDDMVFADGDHLGFDGGNDYINCEKDVSLNITDALTMEGWVKINRYSNDHSTSHEFIGKGHDWALFIVDGYPRFYGYKSGIENINIMSPDRLNLNEWYHITATYYKNTNGYLYVNGIQKAEGSAFGILRVTTNTFRVGATILGLNRYISGSIDEVRIYNRCLTEEEIYRQYIRSKYAVDVPILTLSGSEMPKHVNISLYSKHPETLFTNYTGFLSASYIVESNYPLNFSSLAYLFGVNYTLTDDYHSYLKVPANDIADDGIYRAHNRNTTPYMHWESNDTITEGNVWKWSGGDNSDFWIQNESINATHTWVNVTGRAGNVFPSMFYLGRQAMYESEKTGIEINKGQGIIFKIWDLEQYRGRSYNYYLSLYFDTQIKSTPNDDIEIWYCNDSFDPTTDDPCLVCDYKDTWTSVRWMDHESWQSHNNVSFAKPLTIHAGTATCPSSPTEVNYIYLKSDTVSSKSYILNATNDDPNIYNLTFAETETMWLRNEISGTNTPHAYTPSFYNTFTRDYLEFTHHLYIANDQDVWGHSDYNTQEIGLSDIPPTYCRFNYFWWNGTTDYYMNGSYTENFNINLTYGFDPDNGASLIHVLSLYDNDYNFIAFVNDSLIGNQTDVDIPFNVSDYLNKYSSGVYRFKIVSTDNEGSTSVTWSNEFCIKRDSWFKTTAPIITGFPAAIGGILTSFLSFLPLFIGILISGFLILVCVGVFGKLKRW